MTGTLGGLTATSRPEVSGLAIHRRRDAELGAFGPHRGLRPADLGGDLGIRGGSQQREFLLRPTPVTVPRLLGELNEVDCDGSLTVSRLVGRRHVFSLHASRAFGG